MSSIPTLSRPSTHSSHSNAQPQPQPSNSNSQHAPQPSAASAPLATLSTQPLPPSAYGAYGTQRLLEKQHEWQGVAMLREASRGLLDQVEALAADGDIMSDGGKAIGSVLANWPNVFRIISLCASSQTAPLPNGDAHGEHAHEPEDPEVLPRLVRLQVEGLQSADGRDGL